jgi:hypothetical protein
VEERIERRHVAARSEADGVRCKAHEVLPTRVNHDQLLAELGRLFEIGGCYRMVGGRACADDDDAIGLHGVIERRLSIASCAVAAS